MEPMFKDIDIAGLEFHVKLIISEFVLVKMIVMDQILISKDVTQFSLFPLEGYKKWSEYKQDYFKDYEFNPTDPRMTLVPVTAPTLNYDSHL